ncbi:peptide-methionine (S)-S-oxide reductase [PVC group bacterium (ex Bugula neritina AB1)]|nr:peptide-methionine (S)-S-oxide reductase [PVC group bacterium (ex Bugula neritina AB1)]
MSLEKATFAGGCFWCMQKPFATLSGVKKTQVGYMGGETVDPTYESVSSGKTGHAEVIEIIYNPEETIYTDLLDVFWKNIDPTQIDQQFYDRGSQYRTAIFYHNTDQQKLAQLSQKKLSETNIFSKPIQTQILQASSFYPAEVIHQDYYKNFPSHYKNYYQNSGREAFFTKTWDKDPL